MASETKGKLPNLNLEGAKLIFRNFSGQPSQFNPEGKRNFCVLLDKELAHQLKSEGWNVRFSTPRDADEEPQGYVQVSVAFDKYPPSINLVTETQKTLLREPDINILDWSEIVNVDLTIRPYEWDVNGNQGVKAYLKSMHVTIEADPFEEKYAGIPTGG